MPKKIFLAILLLLAISLTGCFGGEERMNLRGRVEDRLTGQALAGVKVEVGNQVLETDANGYFILEDIPVIDDIDERDRMLKVAAPGYRIYAEPVILEEGDKSVTVKLERSKADQFFVVSDQKGSLSIYLTDIYGNNLEQLTSDDANDWAPSWSAKREELLFLSDRSGATNIYRLNLETEELRQITNTQSDKLDPSWANDELLYSSNRDGNYNLYQIDLTDSYQRRLSNKQSSEQSPYFISLRNEIVYISDTTGEPKLHSMAADGSRKIILNSGPGTDKTPLWWEKNKSILFANSNNGQDKFYQVNPNGSGLKELFSSDYQIQDASILELDELLLLYTVTRDGKEAVKLYSASGEKRFILVDEAINYSEVAWKE